MSDRPTPETDAKVSFRVDVPSCVTVPVDLARKLERERDEAREAATEQFIAAGKAARERDEAREALSQIAFYLSVGMGDETTTAQQYQQRILEGIKFLMEPIAELRERAERERDEWAAMCGRYKQERDEAREQAARWLARLQEEGLEEYGN